MTSIEWTDETWNCVVGCSIVSPGCENCYAMGVAHRGMSEQHRGLTVLRAHGKGPRWNGEVRMVPQALEKPLRRRKPTKYFVNSMSDLFHESLVDSEDGREFIAAVFGVMAACPQHTFQVLTKRPTKAAEWFAWLTGPGSRGHVWQSLFVHASRELLHPPADLSERMGSPWPWPLPNVWLGVSVEDQKRADERIPILESLPAAVKFLSCEPLLGPVDLVKAGAIWDDLADGAIVRKTSLDWVIVGGESGHRARPMHPEWARKLREQCAYAGVQFFFKQHGAWSDGDLLAWTHAVHVDGRVEPCEPPSGSMAEIAAWRRRMTTDGWAPMRRIGKKHAGRLLDGQTHDGFPG